MFKVTLCLLFLLQAYVHADNHYIDDCIAPGTTPTALYNREVSKPAKFLDYQEEQLRVPATGFAPSPITCISVINLMSDKDGGYPKIIAGGVKDLFVTFDFKSQLSKAYDFKVSVYYDADA